MTVIYTAELTVYDDALGGLKTLYLCTGNGFVTRPTDSPANIIFEPLIIQPALMRLDAFQQGTTAGRSTIGVGDLVLNNASGALDGLVDYGLDGRQAILRVGDDEAAYPSGHSVVLNALMEFVKVGPTTAIIRLRDRQFLLEKEFNPSRYAGTNSLPNGLEGLPTDIKGAPKPRVYGEVKNVTPVLVNTSRLIYQVNDGAVNDIPQAYDRGLAFTRGIDYSSQVDMESSAPAAGTYRVWKAGGCFRLGATPAGIVTCNCVQGSTAAERTAASIILGILQGPGGVSLGDIDAASFTALDALNSAVCGVYVKEEANIPEVLDSVAGSVGAFWGVGKDGKFRVRRISTPAGSPVIDFDKNNILKIERGETQDDAKGVPPYLVLMFYGKNYTVQTTDVNGAVTAARRGELAQEWQQASSLDLAIKTKHLLSPAICFYTQLLSEADARAEGDRRLTMYGTRRDLVNVEVALDPSLSSVLDLGIVTRLTYARYGYNAGKLFTVIGYALDSRRNRATVTLWG